jgi:hypothetical protein
LQIGQVRAFADPFAAFQGDEFAAWDSAHFFCFWKSSTA